MSNNKISSEFEIKNPDELFDFIKDKEGIIDFINQSLSLFKRFYPNAKYILEYIDYLEGNEFNTVFCFITDEKFDDFEIYKKLSHDFALLNLQYMDINEYYDFCLDTSI